MNQRGIWQLILMAREGDRQAIDELFYASLRSSYLVLLSAVGDAEKALDLLAEGYLKVFASLDEIEQADAFSYALNSYTLGRAREQLPDGALTPDASDAALSAAFLESAPQLHDFNTIQSLDMSSYADEILFCFQSQPAPAQVCAFLYYYAELPAEQIAAILSTEPDVVLGTLQAVRQAVLPRIEEILQRHDAFRGTDAESAVLWALRNTARFAPVPARAESFHETLLGEMVERGLLESAISPEPDLLKTDDIPIRDMQPPRENRFLKALFSLRSLIILLCILILCAGFFGIRQLRAYHARRSGWNDFTERTTLSMTNTALQLEHYVFSTEYEAPTETTTETTTEPPVTTAEDESSETLGHEPTEAVITTKKAGSDFAFSVSGNQVTITGYKGSRSTVEVPAQIDGMNVTAIGESAFFNSSLTGVKLPSTVKTIGKNAFQNCSGLQSVSLPSGVTTLEENAFRGCSNLRTVTLSDTLKKIGSQAFSRCTSLTSVSLPDSLQSIGEWSFAYCTSLTSVSIPGNVTSIGSSAFYECKSLTRCSIGTSPRLSTLGDSVFFDCTSLTSFTFPSTIRSVPANFFVGCRSLTSVTLSSNTTSIGSNAFRDCVSLSSVKLPSGVTRVDACAFQNCISLTSITFPSTVTSIGETAFSGCTALTSATIPSSVKTIGNNAFAGCSRVVFHCPAGSAAEKYADKNNIEVYGRTTENTENSESSEA